MVGDVTYQELQDTYEKATFGHVEPDIVICSSWSAAVALSLQFYGEVNLYCWPSGPGFSVR